MTEPTPTPERPEQSEQSEPATGPVYTSPPGPSAPPPGVTGPHPYAGPTRTVYVPQPPSRLNKVAAWVGIVAGSVFIVAVIFGTGFFVGKQVGHEGRHHGGGPQMMRPGAAMFPIGPPGGFERGPNNSGPFGPGGPMIVIPRSPQGPGGPNGPDTTTAPPRP